MPMMTMTTQHLNLTKVLDDDDDYDYDAYVDDDDDKEDATSEADRSFETSARKRPIVSLKLKT